MAAKSKKRGQKLSQRLAKFSRVASENSQEHIKENLVRRLPHARNVRLLILEWSLLMAALILLAITQAFWHSESNATIAYTSGGTYTEATLGEIESLNPLFATSNSEQTISKLMFATITTVDFSGHAGLGLADSILSDETGRIWTIHLRDNLKWSDGEPITNADVIFTIKLIQSNETNTAYSSNFAKVSVVEDEAHNLVFTLPAPYTNFASVLNVPVVPEHILKDANPANLADHVFSTTSPVVSGAFTYNASQIIDSSTGEQIVYLTANPNYYGGKPLINTFAIHSFSDTDDIVKAISSGSVTATADLNPTFSQSIDNNNIYKKETTINNGVFAFFNMSSPILNNKSLRKAIQQGVNKDELRSCLGEEPALDYPILKSQTDSVKFPELPKYDFENAKNIVASAGLNSEEPLSIITVANGYLPELANNLSAQLQRLGFATTVTAYDPNQDFLANVIRPRSYDILLYEIELGVDPDLFAYYHSSQASANGFNLSNYRNPLTDDVILSARNTIDSSIAANKYETFLNYWLDDVPAIGIYQTNLAYYFNKNTRNFSENNHLATKIDRLNDVVDWSAVQTKLNRTP